MTGIFKAYDIRGTYPDSINEELVERIGDALVRVLNAHRIVIGRDCRTSGPQLREALVSGITAAGCDVVDIGLCSTDMLYFASEHLGMDGGVMITASHNPAGYNGLKMVREHAIPLSYETGIGEIEEMVKASGGVRPGGMERPGGMGKVEQGQILDAILNWFGRNHPPAWERRVKIVLDAGNGMGGTVAGPLLKRYPFETVEMLFEPDGTFPIHHPDPLIRSNLTMLSERVRREGAEFGVAFDGDADRCVFVDNMGRPVPGDIATGLLARVLLPGRKGGVILYDLRASRFVRDTVEALGGRAVESRVGHSYIKQTMRQENALFAGELSGHYYFRIEGMYAENPIIPILLMTELLCSRNMKLSEIMDSMDGYHVSGEINFRVKDKEGTMELAVRELGVGGKVTRLDGVKVDHEDWWFNLRPSNTEPLLRLNMEANTPELLEEKKALLMELLGRQAEK